MILLFWSEAAVPKPTDASIPDIVDMSVCVVDSISISVPGNMETSLIDEVADMDHDESAVDVAHELGLDSSGNLKVS